MLDAGEIDAIFTARAPSSFTSGSPNVRRLFGNYWEVEEDYFRRTGIFPIMHTIVIKRKIYEENRGSRCLLQGFVASKNMTLEVLQNTASLHSSLPWLVRSVEHAKKLMGDDWWTYGIEKNRHALDTLCRIISSRAWRQKRWPSKTCLPLRLSTSSRYRGLVFAMRRRAVSRYKKRGILK